ncbi:MAG: sulfotransferase domain-containing protein [Actinomycetota bacterium]
MGGGLVLYKSIVMDSSRWEGFVFRDDDVIISTPAKCGTTWMQMIMAMLVFQDPALPRSLAEISPWLEMLTSSRDEVVALLEAQDHRRFIKSHTPLDGLPFDERVTYVCVGRDPRDVAFSWDNHMANMNLENFLNARAAAVGLDDLAELGPIPTPAEDPIGRFWQWVDDVAESTTLIASLQSTILHLASFWAERDRPNIVLVHYSDLLRDLEGEMRRLAGRLGIDVPEERWPVLVDAARFEQMKARADLVVPDSTHAIWQDNTQFFDKGGCRWRGVLSDDDLARYEARVARLDAPADLIAWAHEGRTAVAPTGSRNAQVS